MTFRPPPVGLAIAGMASVQLGAVVSIPLFSTIGVAGTTWLRLTVAATILLAVVRPRGLSRAQLGAAAMLGVVLGGNSVIFAAATHRVPLGVVVAVEFCGPLSLAALSARAGSRAGRVLWPLVALAGVVILTRPWQIGGANGTQTWIGLGLAATAAVGWAGYIVLTAHIGSRSEGFAGLAVALAVGALVLAPFGAGSVWTTLQEGHWTALARCGLAALLVPLGAFTLEMATLRRMPAAVFGVWMALEPMFAALAGLLLGQAIGLRQLPGFVLVVVAGVATQRAAGQPAPPPPTLPTASTTATADPALTSAAR
jgi:inner membrane transporter RhtA